VKKDKDVLFKKEYRVRKRDGSKCSLVCAKGKVEDRAGRKKKV